MRQQPRQQCDVDFTVFSRLAVNRDPQFFNHLTQLGVDILPFAHAQIVQVFGPAQTTKRIGRQRFLLLAEIIPQIHKREEIRLFVVETTVHFVGRLLFVHRTLARVLNRQCRSDDHRLAHAAVLLRFQHHARQTRIDRQLA
ncbi:hypothetical protein D3C80_1330680 [compost metagenome]